MFRYLNLENKWPGFKLDGLTNDSGTLRLARLPGTPEIISPPLSGVSLDAEGLTGPARAGVDAEGNVYIPDPAGNRVLHWRACDGAVAPLRCFGGAGSLPGQLKTPRGVLAGPREALYLADSGNHRIQVVDIHTQQLRAIWGQPDPFGEPQSGSAPGRFDEPWDLAADSAGFVYVVDHGNRRVQKFDSDGRVVTAFWATLQTQPMVPGEPAYIATALLDGQERLLILDQSPSRVLVYGTDGACDDQATSRWTSLALPPPGGLVFVDGTLYVGDGAMGRVLAFDAQGNLLGEMHVPAESIAGLILDKQGRLLVHPGAGGAVTRLLPGQVYANQGSLVAGPFSTGDRPTRWQRVQVMASTLTAGAHVRFFTRTSETASVPPDPDGGWLADSVAVGPDVWRAAPADCLDFLVLHEPAPYLWIGGILQGDGHVSPALEQIRLEFEREGWLRYLPAIYGRDERRRVFLDRALALFEGLFDKAGADIDDLPLLFDPWAATDRFPALWLDWLSTWVAFDLDETWTPTQRRQALADAFELLGRRGTVESLRQLIALYAGVDAVIDEPVQFASVWSLGETSTLGFTTMLAAAEAQGAVLGTTATLDRSHLIDEADYGAPLFEDVAHRFCVRVRAAPNAPDALATLRRVVDREKPAHTTYHLCVIEPRMRVGAQAQLGVDAIVAGPLPDMALGQGLELGAEMALASPAQHAGKVLGEGSRIGTGLHLI
jgi:phage tail-like protein